MRHRTARGSTVTFLTALLLCGSAVSATAAEPDWSEVGDEAVRLLGEYVRIDTRNPPGRTVEAVEFLEPLLQQAGLETERIIADPEKPILLGRMRGTDPGKKPVILLHHMDVVPAQAERWSLPPLGGQQHEGNLYGRGTVDMKGMGIAQLAALRLLGARKEFPRHDVLFLAVPDEEIGGGMGVRWLSQNRPDIMDAAGVWDEGGVGVADKFPKPVLFVSIAEKQVLWLRLVAEGPSGHGSRPFPEAAPLRLQQALHRILTRPPPARLNPVARKMFRRVGRTVSGARGFAMRNLANPLVWPFVRGQLHRDPVVNATIRDTISLTVLRAGYKPNVIPERAEAVLDCRLLPGTKQETFLAELARTIDDPAIRVEVIEPADPSPPSSVKNDLFKAIEAASHLVYPDAVVSPFMAIGATDSRFFRRLGVPAYGLVPMILPQQVIETAHGIDERVPVSALAPAVRVVYEALRRL